MTCYLYQCSKALYDLILFQSFYFTLCSISNNQFNFFTSPLFVYEMLIFAFLNTCFWYWLSFIIYILSFYSQQIILFVVEEKPSEGTVGLLSPCDLFILISAIPGRAPSFSCSFAFNKVEKMYFDITRIWEWALCIVNFIISYTTAKPLFWDY